MIALALLFGCAAPDAEADARFAAATGAGIGTVAGVVVGGLATVALTAGVIASSGTPARGTVPFIILGPTAIGAVAGAGTGAFVGATANDVDGKLPATGAALGALVGLAPGALMAGWGLANVDDASSTTGLIYAGLAVAGVGVLAGGIVGAAVSTSTESCVFPGTLP